MDLDGLSTAAGAAASPGVTTHGPAAEVLLEGAECDAETEDTAGSSNAAAAVGIRPPRPVDWATAGAAGAAKDWQMGNASAAAAAAVADGAAEDGRRAAVQAEAGRPAKPSNWLAMTKPQKRRWRERHGKWSAPLGNS